MENENSKILVIEDDPDIREGIRILLESEGYEVDEAGDGETGLEKLDDKTDLILLDVMLPGISGLKTCEKIRKKSFVPIIFLTAKSQDSDKLIGLLAGGDDYLTKPFSYSELLGRIKAQMRRYKIYQGKQTDSQPSNEPSADNLEQEQWICCEDLKINKYNNEVLVNDNPVDLSDIEYRMLLLLAMHPNKIFSSENLYESIWNETFFYNNNNTVMVHIRKLRVHIEPDPKKPIYIKTVWGKGYKFNENTRKS